MFTRLRPEFVIRPFSQDVGLLVRLDTLGDDFDMQVTRNRNDRADDCIIARIGGEIADEAFVDLQSIDLPILEIREARITGAKVVDVDFNAQIAQ